MTGLVSSYKKGKLVPTLAGAIQPGEGKKTSWEIALPLSLFRERSEAAGQTGDLCSDHPGILRLEVRSLAIFFFFLEQRERETRGHC